LWQQLLEEEPENYGYRYFFGKLQSRIGQLQQRESVCGAGEPLRKAMAIQKELIQQAPLRIEPRLDLSETLANLTTIHLRHGESLRATELAEQSIEILEEIPHEGMTLRPDYYRYLANAYLTSSKVRMASGDAEGSVLHCRRALELCRSLVEQGQELPMSSSRLARALGQMGKLSAQMGNTNKSFEEYLEAVERMEKLVSDHPELTPYKQELANLYADLATQYRGQRRLEESLRFRRKENQLYAQLAAERPKEADFHCRLVRSHYLMGALHESLTGLDDALAALDQGEAVVRRLPPEAMAALGHDTYGMAGLFRTAARIRAAMGDRSGGAENAWQRAITQNRWPPHDADSQPVSAHGT
jgi:tetratricopeptide (TPR) repeat protein